MSKDKEEISKLKQEIKLESKENKENLKVQKNNELKSQIKNFKKEIVELEKKLKKKNTDFLKTFLSYSYINEKEFKKLNSKTWNFYLNKLNSLNSFKNFVVRESFYYKFGYKAKGFLKYLFIPLFRISEKRKQVYDALESVGLKKEHAYRYPHEFSGGQRQRIVIARALITNPKLVVADEPISALDVSIQSQVVNIMKKLAKEKGVTFLFIAHDLSMVNNVCNKVIIMHRGKILEGGDVENVFTKPTHPYTRSLMKAVPKLSRIHVDLASFDEKHEYDKNYSLVNIPKYYSIDSDNKHYVFGTESQIKEWKKEN
ncbi:MAG: ABC transporter ATP-binding protein [Malacoplasma sp.]|nr:ABC transporter ATP-binding protein [Malacoplasma sp.]